MAIVTYTASSRGASATVTVNDATLRATAVDVVTTARQIRIVLFNALGEIARDVTIVPNTTQSVTVDVPARLVEIEKADTTIKSYVVPPFAVFF